MKKTQPKPKQQSLAVRVFTTICIIIVAGGQFYRAFLSESPEERKRKVAAGAMAEYERRQREADEAFANLDRKAAKLATQSRDDKTRRPE